MTRRAVRRPLAGGATFAAVCIHATVAVAASVLVLALGCAPSVSSAASPAFTTASDSHPHQAGNPVSVLLDVDASGLVRRGFDVDDDLCVLAALDAHRRGDLRLLGVTTVAGNAAAAATHDDVRALMRLAGEAPDGDDATIPVLRGADFSLARSLCIGCTEDGVHSRGKGAEWERTPASEFIVDTLRAEPPRSVVIVALGPLSNVAAALYTAPDIAARIRSLVIMGGDLHHPEASRGAATGLTPSLRPGRPQTPRSVPAFNLPFNMDLNLVIADPLASQTVLTNEAFPRILVPVQTTIQVAVTRRETDVLRRACGGEAGDSASDVTLAPSRPVVCELLPKLQGGVDREKPPIINDLFRGVGYDEWRTPRAPSGFFPWDVAALMALLAPGLVGDWHTLRVSVDAGHLLSRRVVSEAVEGHEGASGLRLASEVGLGLGLEVQVDAAVSDGCDATACESAALQRLRAPGVVLSPLLVHNETALLDDILARLVRVAATPDVAPRLGNDEFAVDAPLLSGIVGAAARLLCGIFALVGCVMAVVLPCCCCFCGARDRWVYRVCAGGRRRSAGRGGGDGEGSTEKAKAE